MSSAALGVGGRGNPRLIGRLSLPVHERAMDIGAAAEHIVIADLLLSGYRAFSAGAQLPYDVVADIDGNLIRVAVKGTLCAKSRPARENSRLCYQFQTARSGTVRGGRKPYTAADVDLLAFVALDIKLVGYIAVSSQLPTIWHIDPPGAYVPSKNGWGPKCPRGSRKTFDKFTLALAIAEIWK